LGGPLPKTSLPSSQAARQDRSVLQQSTLDVLHREKHVDREAAFRSDIQAENFEKAYCSEPLRLVPRTDGRCAVIDERRPFGDRTVEVTRDEASGFVALKRRADAEGLTPPPGRTELDLLEWLRKRPHVSWCGCRACRGREP
jgi:hypothetical protein